MEVLYDNYSLFTMEIFLTIHNSHSRSELNLCKVVLSNLLTQYHDDDDEFSILNCIFCIVGLWSNGYQCECKFRDRDSIPSVCQITDVYLGQVG